MLPTLLCLHGRDSGNRFGLITLAAALSFLLINSLAIHASDAIRLGFALVTGLAAVVLAGLSARRRLADAARPLSWAAAPAGLMALLVVVQIALPFSLWLLAPLLLLAAVAGTLAIWPAKPGPKSFAPAQGQPLGYSGPRAQVAPSNRRVEPSLHGRQPPASAEPQPDTQAGYWDEQHAVHRLDLAALLERLRHWKPMLPKIGLALALPLAAVLAWLAWPESQQPVEAEPLTAAEPDAPAPTAEQAFDHRLAMPDTYELRLKGESLAIVWPGDTAPKGILWDQLSAQGDSSCQVIRFNNGTTYRSMEVVVFGDHQYLASFSALDTAAIVKDVAMRGRFELCGYSFKLKGSMAALESAPAFSRWL